jgi:dsRNA-specific ribonuclease
MNTANVILPISISPSLRFAQSERSWKTERMAKNDAAFQAYKALYQAGLVNNNMLPDRQQGDDNPTDSQIPDYTSSLIEFSPTFDPWVVVAEIQQRNPQPYYRILLNLKAKGNEPISMVLLTPFMMPGVPEFVLHWNKSTDYSIESSFLPEIVLSEIELKTMRSITRTILYSIFHSRMEEARCDFLYLLIPSSSYNPTSDHISLKQWDENSQEYSPASKFIEQRRPLSEWGVIRISGEQQTYLLKSVSYDTTEAIVNGTTSQKIASIRLPKRRDFLHPINENTQSCEAYTRTKWLNAADCIVSNMPASYSLSALFAPSILRKYEIYMVADTLRTTILKPLGLDTLHLSLLVRAITSSDAGEEVDYQREEFLGDCILKFISSLHLTAAHLIAPESWLTRKKAKVVSNGFLARAALLACLDKFVITKRFTGSKWIPRYASDILNQKEPSKPPQQRSSKVLADVVESLIGISYVIGGLEKAYICVRTLLPLEPWIPITEANHILFDDAPHEYEPSNLGNLKTLVGYAFTKKLLLLEALTHASYNYAGLNTNIKSYDRLEFFGDALLDYIISKRLYNHTPDLSHQKMHAIRTTMVNAAFLAFRMLETTVAVSRTDKSTFEEIPEHRALWQFLRHSSLQIVAARDAALMRHKASRKDILIALRTDSKFPWHLLSLIDAPKIFSDIVESVIGAIYVDSHGSIESCEIFVRNLGIFDCLERVLHDEVDCLHPKERLGHLAIGKDVQYVKVVDGEEKKVIEGTKVCKIQIKIGGENVGVPVKGSNRLNAETIAAWKAVRAIERVHSVGMVDSRVNVGESEDEWYDAEE